MTAPLIVRRSQHDAFRADVLAGLSRRPRALPSKYFYDDAGAKLFERITLLPEYYLTRTEIGILEAHIEEIAEVVGPRAVVIEPGSGSGRKTRLLLDSLDRPVAYVPIDVSLEQLQATARALRAAHDGLSVLPVDADFTLAFALPALPPRAARRVVFFPGSTIGNLTPREVDAFFHRIVRILGARGGLLVGVDLRKDPAILRAAYNDAEGVTAAFNMNLLRRINRELGGSFDLAYWRHRAAYDAERGRIEMYLDSLVPQTVHAAGETFDFEAGEAILTEYSHKYDLGAFGILAREAGLAVRRTWTDPRRWFAMVYLEAAST